MKILFYILSLIRVYKDKDNKDLVVKEKAHAEKKQ